MKKFRMFIISMFVLILCCGCQRNVAYQGKGNIILYQVAEDGSHLESAEYEMQGENKDNVVLIHNYPDAS